MVAIGGRSSAGTENIWRKPVKLLTILVSYDRASRGSCVSGNGHSTLNRTKIWSDLLLTQHGGTYVEDDSADGRSSLGVGRLGLHVGLGFKGRVSQTVIVVEASKRHLIEIVELHHCFTFYD